MIKYKNILFRKLGKLEKRLAEQEELCNSLSWKIFFLSNENDMLIKECRYLWERLDDTERYLYWELLK